VRRILAPVFVIALLALGGAAATGSTVDASGPPMGWNSRLLGCNVTEASVRQAADGLASTGLAERGYRYLMLDDCWAAADRDAAGQLRPDPARFPSGIAALAAELHARGFRLGLNVSSGTKMCTRGPGSYGREAGDAARLVDWGVDLVRLDWCSIPTADFPGKTVDVIARELSGRMNTALAGTEVTLTLNNEDGSTVPWTWAGGVATSWRTNVYNRPIADDYDTMVGIFEFNMLRGGYAGPGQWNDPDLLLAGRGAMSAAEYRTQFSLWAVMAAPLFVTSFQPALVGHPDVIAIDQDPGGVQGRFVSTDGWHHVIDKPLAGGDHALALFNESDRSAVISTSTRKLGLPSGPAYRVTDVWTGATTSTSGEISLSVPAHGAALLRVGRHGPDAPPATTLVGDAPPAIPSTDKVSVVEPGRATTVTVTLANSGGTAPVSDVDVSLEVPAGWSVSAASGGDGRLGAGERLEVPFTVSPPADATLDIRALTARATYRSPHGDGTATATTDVRVAVAPAPGTTSLSDAMWTYAANHLGPVERDRSNGDVAAGDGKAITIGGVTYPRGLGVHGPSDVEFYLGGRCGTVTAEAGVDGEVGSNGSVVFQIWADGELAARTGIVRGGQAAVPLRADVTGASFLRLTVTNGGDNAYFDHSDWGAATITCA
jgi:alpha-galactosidase